MSKVTTSIKTVASQPPAEPDFDAERQINELRSTVNEVDLVAQTSLGQISAIAKLALIALEAPDPHNHTIEHVAKALELIYDRAGFWMDDITAQAEALGCNHIDEHARRRMAARAR